MPTFWGNRTDSPQVGSNPTLAWVSAKRACSDAIRMSQYSANSRPPVTAAPLIAPITGLFIGGHCGEMSGSSVESPSSLRSSPAQNTGSVPVRMTTSTSSSTSASVSAPKNRSRSAEDSALRDCGRFRVRVRTRSSVVISRMSSVMASPEGVAPAPSSGASADGALQLGEPRLDGGELTAQRSLLIPALGHLTHDRRYSDDAVVVLQEGDTEFDRQAVPVPVSCRHAQ